MAAETPPGVLVIAFIKPVPMVRNARKSLRYWLGLNIPGNRALPESGQPVRQNSRVSDSNRRRANDIVRMRAVGNAARRVNAASRGISEHAHTVLHSSSICEILRTIPAWCVHVRLDATAGGSVGGVEREVTALVHSALDVWRAQSNGNI